MRFELVDPAKRQKTPPNRLGNVRLGFSVAAQRFSDNLTMLCFHRAAVARSANSQPLFQRCVYISNCQCRHGTPLSSLHALKASVPVGSRFFASPRGDPM